MKYRSFILALAGMVLCSCAKVAGGEASSAADEPVPILFRTAVDIQQEQREGPKSVMTEWNGEELMLFGIHRRNGVLDLTPSGRYIDGTKANAPSGGTSGFVSNLINPVNNNPYYYPSQGTLDFFAGYLAGAVVPSDLYEDVSESGVQVRRISEKYVDVQQKTLAFTISVDGTQDVMTAYTDRDADCRRLGYYAVSPDNAYSSQSARASVYPTLRFFHVLSRLSLKAKALASGLRVKDVRVSGRNTGKLALVRPQADQTPSFDPGSDYEHGILRVEGPFPLDLSTVQTKDLGDCMIVPGDDQCVVLITLQQLGKEGTTQVTVDMSKYGLTFESGIWYDLLLSIYGLEKVDVTVTMNSWGVGYGEFDINPDI